MKPQFLNRNLFSLEGSGHMENLAQPELEILEQTDSQPQQPLRWSLAHRIFFRFICSYFVLYAAPEIGRVSLLPDIPGATFLATGYLKLWHGLTPWVAIHVFHLSGRVTTYFRTGSGDTTLGYIENLLYLVFAIASTLLWSIADYKRCNYGWLHAWLRVLIRCTLAFTLFSYGFAKVFPIQFSSLSFYTLTEPYGDFSPMGALWYFMGASRAYAIFSGSVEVISGLLLLSRRTTTLGAMLSAAVLVNIAALNFCYDIPVKLYSVNLFLMAVFLLAPDLRRLTQLFLLNRATASADLSTPAFRRRWARLAAVGFQVLFVGYYLFGQVRGGWTAYAETHLHPQRPPIYGLYDVETFSLNGQLRPPLLTDGTRWNKVMLDFPTFFQVRLMDNSLHGWIAKYDDSKGTVTLSRRKNRSILNYSRPDAQHVLIEGKLDNDVLSVRLRQFDISKYLLVSRGFHWINEVPLNH
jgi:hypothetical protein